MLTTFDRILRAWRRKVRLEAALSYRESDRRVPGEEYTWTRHRPMQSDGAEEPASVSSQGDEEESHA